MFIIVPATENMANENVLLIEKDTDLTNLCIHLSHRNIYVFIHVQCKETENGQDNTLDT